MSFKEWIESHDEECNWDWNDPNRLHEQLVRTIKDSGSIDIKPIFCLFFDGCDTGLTTKQIQRFLKEVY